MVWQLILHLFCMAVFLFGNISSCSLKDSFSVLGLVLSLFFWKPKLPKNSCYFSSHFTVSQRFCQYRTTGTDSHPPPLLWTPSGIVVLMWRSSPRVSDLAPSQRSFLRQNFVPLVSWKNVIWRLVPVGMTFKTKDMLLEARSCLLSFMFDCLHWSGLPSHVESWDSRVQEQSSHRCSFFFSVMPQCWSVS